MKFPTHPFKTHGGAKVPHFKNTKDLESIIMPPPNTVTIPMQQHIGAPCKPTVKVGDKVKLGQIIGDSESFVCAPIHSSVSGKVSKITKIMLPSGNNVEAVVIESDGEMRLDENIKPPVVNNAEDLITAARNSGLVGLGGAGFPAHIKLNIPKDKNVDTLIINVAECEPFITSDYREVIENSWGIMSGIYAIKDILNIERAIIAIEANKPDAIKILSEIAESKTHDPDDLVRVLTLKDTYPQGAEKVIVKACTNREIPPGKLPSDVGCIVMNVTSVAFLSDYLKTGIPLVKKRITVDGSAINEPKNIIVPIGTKISDLINFAGVYKLTPKKILMGGPMMGLALVDDSLPVLKQNNAILAFSKDDADLPNPTACIRCGRCIQSCPMKLMPVLLEKYVNLKNVEELKKLHINNCMECGSCAFNCPAYRPLVQAIRLGKNILKNSK